MGLFRGDASTVLARDTNLSGGCVFLLARQCGELSQSLFQRLPQSLYPRLYNYIQPERKEREKREGGRKDREGGE